MNTYPKYKDNGEQWLGQIPEHWEIRKLKYVLQLRKKIVGADAKKYDLLSLTLKGVIKRDVENPTGKFPTTFDSYQEVNENDFIFCNFDNEETPRAVGLSPYRGMITGAYDVLRRIDEQCNDKFLFYYFLWIDDAKRFKPLYRGLRKTIPLDSFLSYKLALPTLAEQEAMVAYLDEQTGAIDKAIQREQAMIDLLEERKQIIIQNAVTKGLNPNAPMKDSGVIGDFIVPEHWRVTKTLYALSMPITDGPHETPELYETGIPFVSAEAVSCGNGRIDFDHIRGFISESFYRECCKKYIPALHDIYMIKSGATTGKVAIVDTDRIFTIWSPLAVFRCNPDMMAYQYMFYLLQSDFYQKQVQLGWSYGTQQNIGMRTLEKLRILLPPIEEQLAIASYLDTKLVYIDKAIAAKNRVIALLQERKQIIISEVVTGKIKIS